MPPSPYELIIMARGHHGPDVASGGERQRRALFLLQPFGTARIGKIFGPLMALWFLAIAALGVRGIVQHPSVLLALNPAYGISADALPCRFWRKQSSSAFAPFYLSRAADRTLCNSTFAPFSDHSGRILSASLWLMPFTQGIKIMLAGAILLT